MGKINGLKVPGLFGTVIGLHERKTKPSIACFMSSYVISSAAFIVNRGDAITSSNNYATENLDLTILLMSYEA